MVVSRGSGRTGLVDLEEVARPGRVPSLSGVNTSNSKFKFSICLVVPLSSTVALELVQILSEKSRTVILLKQARNYQTHLADKTRTTCNCVENTRWTESPNPLLG